MLREIELQPLIMLHIFVCENSMTLRFTCSWCPWSYSRACLNVLRRTVTHPKFYLTVDEAIGPNICFPLENMLRCVKNCWCLFILVCFVVFYFCFTHLACMCNLFWISANLVLRIFNIYSREKYEQIYRNLLCQFVRNNDNNSENLWSANPVKNCAKRCTVIQYILTENEQEKIFTNTININIELYQFIHLTHLQVISSTVKSHNHLTLQKKKKKNCWDS